MKIVGLILLALAAIGVAGFFFLAQKSKTGTPPGLAGGVLTPCPSSPNCVSSEAGADEKHRVDPLPLDAWERLPDVIAALGGKVVASDDAYIASEFSSKLMGFVDDVELRRSETEVQVRSASRVGYGDAGVNRKRVEALRTALAR